MSWNLAARAWSHLSGDEPPEDASAYFRERSNWKPLAGTCLSAAAYFTPVRKGSGATPVLAVRFKDSGKVYWYLGVPQGVAAFLFVAPSKGKYYNAAIKGSYEYRGPIG